MKGENKGLRWKIKGQTAKGEIKKGLKGEKKGANSAQGEYKG